MRFPSAVAAAADKTLTSSPLPADASSSPLSLLLADASSSPWPPLPSDASSAPLSPLSVATSAPLSPLSDASSAPLSLLSDASSAPLSPLSTRLRRRSRRCQTRPWRRSRRCHQTRAEAMHSQPRLAGLQAPTPTRRARAPPGLQQRCRRCHRTRRLLQRRVQRPLSAHLPQLRVVLAQKKQARMTAPRWHARTLQELLPRAQAAAVQAQQEAATLQALLRRWAGHVEAQQPALLPAELQAERAHRLRPRRPSQPLHLQAQRHLAAAPRPSHGSSLQTTVSIF